MSDDEQSPQGMVWSPDRVRRFWDYESQFPERYFTYKYAGGLVAAVREHLAGAQRVLDFGCGRGFLVEKLLELGVEVAAADDSPQSVAHVSDRFDGRDRFLGAHTVDEIERGGERYDAIFVVEVVEHLDDAALEQLCKRVGGMTAPGGLVVFTTPNNEDLVQKEVLCPACNQTFHRWGHVRSWTADTLSDWVRARGWEVVQTIEGRFAKAANGRPWRSRWKRLEKRLNLRHDQPHLTVVCRVP